MNNKQILRLFIFFTFFLSLSVRGQDRYEIIKSKLDELSEKVPGLNEKVELSVNGTTLQEFIHGLANANRINISVDATLNTDIYNNFSNVTVSDVLLFLCKKYGLDISFVGTILSVTKYIPPPPEPQPYIPKQLKISYDLAADKLSLDLNNDSLAQVAREITKVSQKNIVFSPDLSGKIVNGFIQSMSFNNALNKFAFANDLKITVTDDGVFLIEKKDAESVIANSGSKSGSKGGKNAKGSINDTTSLNIQLTDEGLLNIDAINTSIGKMIKKVSAEASKNYFLFSELKGTTSMSLVNATYDDFLRYLLNGTEYTYKKDGDTYLIGERNIEGLRETKIVELKFRTVDKIIDYIPADLKKGVELKIFPDLNGLILCGSQPRINEIEAFLREIDQVVPVVVIEILIVDTQDSKTLATGISAGLGSAPATTSGSVFPGINMTLSSNSINNIISGINGLGLVNLGKVTPNFYLNISALETRGILNTRSTPKLATINGHEAKMSIGTTDYYLETANNVIGSQNPQNIITQQYKSVSADLAVTVTPMVSSDEQITLDITVKQSDFTARISPSAPPGTITRDFQSLIRVKNGEMIVLGGLEENTTNDAVSGTPLLSRIPILKWLFSNRTLTKSKDKLSIFITPTIIY